MQLDYLVIDQQGITDTTKDIEEVTDVLKMMFQNVKVLLYINDENIEETYIENDFYTTINAAHKEVKTELNRFFGNEVVEEEFKNTWIGIAAAHPKAGATTQAINIANYIKQYDNSVCYTEANETNNLSDIAEFYEFEKLDKDHYKFENLTYRSKKIDMESHYLVLDLGVLNEKNIELYNKCKVKILVTGSKPYEIKYLDNILNNIEVPGLINVLLNYTAEQDKNIIRNKYLEESNLKIVFGEYAPSLFEVVNKDIYKNIFSKFLVIPEEEEKTNSNTKKKNPFSKIISKSAFFLLASISIGLNMLYFLFSNPSNTGDTKDVYLKIQGIELTEHIRDSTNKTTEVANVDEVNKDPPSTTENETTKNSTTEYVKTTTTTKAPTTATPTTQAPQTTATTEAKKVVVSSSVSLSGYNGQIYSGENVIYILNKFAGQRVAFKVTTRDSSCWYNYEVSGNDLVAATSVSSANVDSSCSYYATVINLNGEDVGIEFLQQ